MNTLTSKSSNEELNAAFKANKDFMSNRAIIATIEDTSNSEQKRLMIIQRKPSKSSNSDDVTAALQGWDAAIERAWVNIKTEILAELKGVGHTEKEPKKLSVGETLSHLMSQFDVEQVERKITVTWATEPRTWTNKSTGEVGTQKQFANRKGEAYYTMVDGVRLPLYRNTSIVADSVEDQPEPKMIKVLADQPVFEGE